MKRLKPLSQAGRQTLVYLSFAGAGPVIVGVLIWTLFEIRYWADASPATRLDRFATLADLVAVAHLVVIIALACFVSIRAIRIGKDGIEAESNGEGQDVSTATLTVSTPHVDEAPPNS